MRRKLAVILASDVAGYSRLVAFDEETTVARFAKLKKAFCDLVESFRGRVFNSAGDALLAEFESATEAVRCAIEIQDTVRARNIAFPEAQKILFRIGIAIGDVLVQEEDGDLLGDGVNIAARLQTMATPGGICLSQEVYAHAARNLSCTVSDLGPQDLKNIPAPVRVYAIEIPGAAPLAVATGAKDAAVPVIAVPPPSTGRRPPAPVIAATAAAALLAAAGGGYILSRQNAPAAPSSLAAAPTLPAPPVGPASQPAQPAATATAPQAPAPAKSLEELFTEEYARYGLRWSKVAIERSVKDYLGLQPSKSLFIAPGIGNWTPRSWGQATELSREHEDYGFEGCQLVWEAPCVQVASEDNILPANDPRRTPRTSPRVAYAGVYNPDMIPVVSSSQRRRDDVRAYQAQGGPKAMALHRDNILRTATGATLREAEAKALEACNASRRVTAGDRLCWTYALDNQVVLPQRRVAPDASPATAAAAPQIAATPPVKLPELPAPPSFDAPKLPSGIAAAPVSAEMLSAELRKLALPEQPHLGPFEKRAGDYLGFPEIKFFMVAPGTGIWRSRDWSNISRDDAREAALEGCQISYRRPCIVLADGLALLSPDNPLRMTPNNMPRVLYSGPFDPDRVPGISPARRRSPLIATYGSITAPKAAAIHAQGRFVVGAGATTKDAARDALDRCNAGLPAAEGPCYVYAMDNQVIFQEWRTKPE